MVSHVKSQRKAVVLLSGGLDSTTVLAIAREEGFQCHALSFRYGQRHAVELESARRVAHAMKTEAHVVVDIDLRVFGGSALTDDIAVPDARADDAMQATIPVTYVPARNTIFLSFAMAWAEVLDCTAIFIGVNALDYSGYPDCRPEFIQAFQAMANLATRAGVEHGARLTIHAPLMALSKAAIIRRGTALGVDYGMTLSCYNPSVKGIPCGACESCALRARGFAEAGVLDPALAGTVNR